MSHVLIVEDDVDAARMMQALVQREGFSVTVAHSLHDARARLDQQAPDLVLLDLSLPDGCGLSLCDEPAVTDAEVVLITGHASLEISVDAFRRGTADYLRKPVTARQLRAVLSRVMRPEQLDAEQDQLRAEWRRSGRFGLLWGRSLAMQEVHEALARVAGAAIPVLVSGEAGTGKALAARLVHEMSRRRHAPFVEVDCAAGTPQRVEFDLFGCERVSCCGVGRHHVGAIERAEGGTLLLDGIDALPLELQVRLLRLLQTGSFSRAASRVVRQADVRLVATCRGPVVDAVDEGRLLEDLYDRLNVFPIAMPSLRSQPGDIELLAQHFLALLGGGEGGVKRFSAAGLARLALYRWPGNVRELRDVVQRAYLMTEGDTVTHQWLPRNQPRAERRTIVPPLRQLDSPAVASRLLD